MPFEGIHSSCAGLSPSPGGGVLLNTPGSTAQEEITFATHPELCAAKLRAIPSLDYAESLVLAGF